MKNQEEHTMLIVRSNLKSSLCNYSDGYILVKEKITINGARNNAAARRANERE